jgi:hypothetical protein
MWNEIVKANWIRERKKASKVMSAPLKAHVAFDRLHQCDSLDPNASFHP